MFSSVIQLYNYIYIYMVCAELLNKISINGRKRVLRDLRPYNENSESSNPNQLLD